MTGIYDINEKQFHDLILWCSATWLCKHGLHTCHFSGKIVCTDCGGKSYRGNTSKSDMRIK